MRSHSRRAGVAFAAAFLCAAARATAAPSPVTITGDPVGPPLTMDGTGLCVTNAVSSQPGIDFGTLTSATYSAGVNAFIESHAMARVTATMRTIFDLSNNNTAGLMSSYGDFTSSMPGTCKTGGCDFFINDSTTSFGSRFRGFLNVTAPIANKPLHFGLFADDAVSVVFFDNKQNQYPVVTQAPVLGAPTWRMTNTVTFSKPGIYPIEILYVEIVEHAALEMSVFQGAFTDFQQPANQVPVTNLKDAGFTLFQATQFFQTDDGFPPFPDLNHCEQCDRRFSGLPGNGGCNPGFYCNEAALCAPCVSSLFCGPTCSPCGGSSPFCVNGNAGVHCVQCRFDTDCKTGTHCDPDNNTCQDCNLDKDCSRGRICNAHKCVYCSTSDSCAGNSCNCCPDGMKQCASLMKDAPPVCTECVNDGDCANGLRCDTINGRCVTSLAPCNTDDRCGAPCTPCPPDIPHCLDGKGCVACRSDVDCGDGQFCLSGDCVPCTADRHCGLRCATCGGDTPYCLSSDGTTALASCVRCLTDADCKGGHCNASTHQCDVQCASACAMGTVCNGAACVQCYANTHCPCGGACNIDSNTCAPTCTDSSDCGDTNHCARLPEGKKCEKGRQKDHEKTEACACLPAVGGRTPDQGGSVLLLIALIGVVIRIRRDRARSSTRQ
jgi:outer membrane exchange protein TraA